MLHPPPPWSQSLLLQATAHTDTDVDLLRSLAVHNNDVNAHMAVVRAERDAAAGRLREAGEAMVDIALWARVSDSYLTRRLLASGATRRVARRR